MASPKIVVVTGANNGIGYEAMKALLQSDKAYHVYLGSRSVEKGKAALERVRAEVPKTTNTVELLPLDLASDQSIENAAEQIKSGSGRVDILVNNAGLGYDLQSVKGKMSLRDCFNGAYNVNVTGTNVFTWALMPLLLKSTDPRLLFVSGLSYITQAAEAYFPTPPQPAGWPKQIPFETIGYRCSKVALNMLTLDWTFKLQADGVKVWAVDPGMMNTGLGNLSDEEKKNMGLLEKLGHPSIGGQHIRSVAEGERDADAGKFVSKDGIQKW